MTRRSVRILIAPLLAVAAAIAAWRIFLSTGHAARGIEVIPSTLVIRNENQQSVTSSVTIRNAGKSVVRLKGVRATCGCTVPEPLAVDMLHPGEQTQLKLSLAVPGVGDRNSIVTILTDDPHQSEITLPVEMHGGSMPAPGHLSATGRSHSNHHRR